jgi:ribosomal subunit interface protein
MIEPQITYRGMEHSAVLDTHIRELVAKMEQFHPKITRIHVIVDELDRNKRNGNVHVPRQEIVATNQEHEDPYVAVNDAFDVLTRQLEENIRKVRGEVKRHTDERGDNATP